MTLRSFAAFFLSAVALALFLALVTSQDASAVTWKVHYDTTLSCDGDTAPQNLGDTDDDSCAGSPNQPGQTADTRSLFQVKSALDGTPHMVDNELTPKHSNFASIRTLNTPPEWSIVKGSAIADGALRGRLITTATLSVLNGPCVTSPNVNIPLVDATTDVNKPVDWLGDGENLMDDPDGNGFPEYIDKYPTYLKDLVDPDYGIATGSPSPSGLIPSLKPWARLAGSFHAVSGAPSSKLNFLIFAPGQLSARRSPYPDKDLGDSLGWLNFVVLDNPTSPATSSSITEFCEPLSTDTAVFGKTQGKALLGLGSFAGVMEFDVPCTDVADDDSDTFYNDGCPVVGSVRESGAQCAATEQIDDDGDTYLNDGCPAVGPGNTPEPKGCAADPAGPFCLTTAQTNPATDTGIWRGDGGAQETHLTGAWAISNRDADGDGVVNNEDGCPLTVDSCVNAIDDAEDAPPDGVANDGCPGMATNDDAPDDTVINDGCAAAGPGLTPESICGDAIDNDNDGTVDDGCPQVGSVPESGADCTDGESACGDTVDNDSDGYVNDGCPAVDVAEGDGDGDGVDAVCDPAPGTKTDDIDIDGFQNRQDNCPLINNPDQSDQDSTIAATDGGGGDGLGDACDPNDRTAETEGDFLVDFVRDAVCLGTDTDGDGWCDDAENRLGPGGNAIGDAADVNQVPEYTGLNVTLAGPPSVPGNCSNLYWYASAGDPAGAGLAIDDDGDTQANAADTNCAALATDTDQDGIVNASDNCPSNYNPEQLNTDGDSTGDACDSDDDGDGISDWLEWQYGGQPKNSTRYDWGTLGLDVTGDGLLTILDVQAYRGNVGKAIPQAGTAN